MRRSVKYRIQTDKVQISCTKSRRNLNFNSVGFWNVNSINIMSVFVYIFIFL